MKTVTRIPLPAPAPGTERSLTVHRYGRPGARPKTYIQAALHADEHPGLLVAHHLLRRLDNLAAAGAIQGEIVVVPFANPVGLSQYLNGYLVGRYDFDSTGNFNRDFPDLSNAVARMIEGRLDDDVVANTALIRRALTETLAQQMPRYKDANVLKLELLKLAIDADYVLDLHCDNEALLHLYASCYQRDIAAELAADIGAAVLLLEDNAGGSPFDEATAGPWWKLKARFDDHPAIALACFATTVEYRGQADVDDQQAEQDALNLLRFLTRRGVIAGVAAAVPTAQFIESPLDAVDLLLTPQAGILAYQKKLGDWVEQGEIVAELVDLTAEQQAQARLPLRSQTSGLFFARYNNKLVRPGQSFCKVAGREKLSYRQSGKLLEN